MLLLLMGNVLIVSRLERVGTDDLPTLCLHFACILHTLLFGRNLRGVFTFSVGDASRVGIATETISAPSLYLAMEKVKREQGKIKTRARENENESKG